MPRLRSPLTRADVVAWLAPEAKLVRRKWSESPGQPRRLSRLIRCGQKFFPSSPCWRLMNRRSIRGRAELLPANYYSEPSTLPFPVSRKPQFHLGTQLETFRDPGPRRVFLPKARRIGATRDCSNPNPSLWDRRHRLLARHVRFEPEPSPPA